jgi:hypothetical protein
MQDRYTGDVGDFGKFGLLRALCRQDDGPPLRLGVVWFLVPDESHNEDGKHTKYLDGSPRFRNCDPELYDELQRLLLDDFGKVVPTRRRVATIEGSNVLPAGTVFFGDPLRQDGTPLKDRVSVRTEWLARALNVTGQADVVFVDPDNGIECQSVSRAARAGPKYIFWDEVKAFAARGQTVVIYHHLSRVCSSAEQVRLLRLELSSRVPVGFTTLDVVFRRGTRRAYFVAAAASHRDALARRLSRMLTTPWATHFIRAD